MDYLLFSAVGALGKYAVKEIIEEVTADTDTDKDESEKGILSKVLSSPGVAKFRGKISDECVVVGPHGSQGFAWPCLAFLMSSN
jgi:hypothetical protein